MRILSIILGAYLLNGCVLNPSNFADTTTTLAYQEKSVYDEAAEVCEHRSAHITRRQNQPIIINGVSYFCF